MRLLVSVSDAQESAAALAGGADLVDAKDPAAGALGAVSLHILRQIVSTIDGARPVTAALGDAADEMTLEETGRDYAAAGATLVKIGFAGITNPQAAARLAAAAVRGVRIGNVTSGIVLVAYADAHHVGSLAPSELIDIASRTGAAGVLLDTADKNGPGLRTLISPSALAAWVATAHAAGLLVALAGKLSIDDLDFVRDAGADIAGVRGAACEHGRTSRVIATNVRRLRERSGMVYAEGASLSTRT